MNEIVIYKNSNNETEVEVQFDHETFWLSLNQIATLFGRDKSVISRHLKKIFDDGELDQFSVVAKNATTANDGKTYQVDFYNLDAILSVGYRVNTKQGTQFRQWATARLKEYLVKGYAINEKRIAEQNMELVHLKNGIRILRRSIELQANDLTEAGNLAELLEQFSEGLSLLDDYDHETLDQKGKTVAEAQQISADECRHLITAMKTEFSTELFGREKDSSFDYS